MHMAFDVYKKWTYYFILGLMAASLPLSRYFMSVSQFSLVVIWLAEGMDINRIAAAPKKERLRAIFSELGSSVAIQVKRFARNRPAVIFASIYLMHILGSAFASDFHHMLADLRVKLPLLSLPVLFPGLQRLGKKEVYNLLSIHALAVFGGTLVTIYMYLSTGETEYRDLFPYFSHIRFSLNAVLAIFNLGYLFLKTNHFKGPVKAAGGGIAIWIILFLFTFKSFTGIVIFLIVTGFILIALVLRTRNNLLRIPFLLIIVAIPATLIWMGVTSYKSLTQAPAPDFGQLDKKTARGNPYKHDTVLYKIENGEYVGLYICKKELKQAWNKRSEIPFDSLDRKNQRLKHTLVRYLASKDLRKDAAGVNALSKKDINHIENGIANVKYTQLFSVKTRIEKIVMGYLHYKRKNDPSGNSVMQRIEYWKASAGLIRQHPVLGIGTGNMKTAFTEQYKRMNTKLDEKFRHRSHNQFLFITVAYGFIGLLWFLFALLYPPYLRGGYKMFLFNLFMGIAFLSMLYEDTLERQAGVTFVSFFFTVYLLAYTSKSANTSNHCKEK